MRLEIKMRGRQAHRTPDIRRNNPGWGDETFTDIESLALPLPTGHTLRLAGFAQYNFFVEASAPLAGGGERIEAFWLCGEVDGRVALFGVYPAQGRIVKDIRPLGQEWGGGATRGWRPGIRAARQVFAVEGNR
jgi:hypothetical protein